MLPALCPAPPPPCHQNEFWGCPHLFGLLSSVTDVGVLDSSQVLGRGHPSPDISNERDDLSTVTAPQPFLRRHHCHTQVRKTWPLPEGLSSLSRDAQQGWGDGVVSGAATGSQQDSLPSSLVIPFPLLRESPTAFHPDFIFA